MIIKTTVKQAFGLLIWQVDFKLPEEFSCPYMAIHDSDSEQLFDFSNMRIYNNSGEQLSDSDTILVKVDRVEFESIKSHTSYFDFVAEIIGGDEKRAKTVLEIVGVSEVDNKKYAKLYYVGGKQYITDTEDINSATEVQNIKKYSRERFIRLRSLGGDSVTLKEVEV